MIRIDSNAREISTGLKHIPVSVRPQMRQAMVRILAHLHRVVVNEKLSEGGILEPRTGHTKRAVFTRLDGDDAHLTGLLGVDVKKAPGARIHEYGGTITAKTAKNLTIPLDAVLTGNKVARFSAHDVIANPAAFGYTGTFFHKGVLFGTTKPKGAGRRQQFSPDRPVPLFVLRRSITLPAREYLKSTLESQADWITAQFNEALKNALGPSDGQ